MATKAKPARRSRKTRQYKLCLDGEGGTGHHDGYPIDPALVGRTWGATHVAWGAAILELRPARGISTAAIAWQWEIKSKHTLRADAEVDVESLRMYKSTKHRRYCIVDMTEA